MRCVIWERGRRIIGLQEQKTLVCYIPLLTLKVNIVYPQAISALVLLRHIHVPVRLGER